MTRTLIKSLAHCHFPLFQAYLQFVVNSTAVIANIYFFHLKMMLDFSEQELTGRKKLLKGDFVTVVKSSSFSCCPLY